MGLFSSKTRINVFANAIPLIDDDYDPIKNVIIGCILTGQDVSSGIINNALTGSSVQVHRMLNYARDEYTLGLPEGVHHTTQTLDSVDVAAAITTDLTLPYGCVVDYNFITELMIDHVVLPFLLEQRQYNKATSQIVTYPPGMNLPAFYFGSELIHSVKVDTVTFNNDHASATIRYIIRSSYATLDADNGNVYIYITRPTTYFEENYTLPNPAIRIGTFHCIAKYSELDSLGSVIPGSHWWFYDVTTGVYPNINFDYTFDNSDSLFPVIPLRYNNVDYTSEAKYDTDLYKTSKKLLKIVGIDINEVGDKLNENPDVGQIDHAYITYGVNLQSTQKESIRYLIEFFDFLYDSVSIQQTNNLNSRLGETTIPVNVFSFNRSPLDVPGEVGASLVEHGLDVSVKFSYITSTYVNGSIGSVGSATKSIVILTSTSYDAVTDTYVYTDDSYLLLRYQETAGAYKEVRVTGLVHINRIYGSYGVITNLADINDDSSDDNFVIPLHYGICKRFPITTRTKLYNQALHIVIYGVQETKVKWYQRAFFKFIVLIITVVIAYYTGRWDFVAMAVVMEILTHILPPKILLALKVILIADAIYSMNPGGVASATLTTAQYFLGMVSALAQLATIPMEVKLLDVMKDMEDLAVEREAATKELEEIQKQLDTSSFLDAGLLLDPPRFSIVPNESPTAFYTRTLMNNAGLLVLNVVENYHTALLKLPEPDYNSAFGYT